MGVHAACGVGVSEMKRASTLLGPFLASRDAEKVEIRPDAPLTSMLGDRAWRLHRGLRMTALVDMAGKGLWVFPAWSQDSCLSIRPHQLPHDNLEPKYREGKLGTRPHNRPEPGFCPPPPSSNPPHN